MHLVINCLPCLHCSKLGCMVNFCSTIYSISFKTQVYFRNINLVTCALNYYDLLLQHKGDLTSLLYSSSSIKPLVQPYIYVRYVNTYKSYHIEVTLHSNIVRLVGYIQAFRYVKVNFWVYTQCTYKVCT